MSRIICISLSLFFVIACTNQQDGTNADYAESAPTEAPAEEPQAEETPTADTGETPEITLKELFTNKSAYGGKTVVVSGTCVKVNENIMGYNWVHLQDGSDPMEEHDLTIMTTDMVSVDQEVSIKGKIVLDKDLGAGYQYAIIMEDGAVMQ